MIEALGSWIVSICVAVFFTTAVQMILPDGSLKKYCNFVLGLIVFTVILSPIVKIFNSDLQMNKLIEESTSYVFNNSDSKSYEEYRTTNTNNTLEKFKQNLEKKCTTDLEQNFKGDKYKTVVNVSYDREESLFVIEGIEIGINDGSVERIKSVQIGKESIQVDSQDDALGKKTAQVKEFVSSRYDINKEKIYVYKGESKENGN